ncbi:G-protein coupled receptor 15-like [Heterodontus francisci]|uniref:G-protein coupled receptor 15-like n=1 Tax=Heterodontus francisci TaxID=7792 RepID=UPI00355C7CF4
MHSPPRGLVYAIYYTALAAISVPVNLVAIVILSRGRCGLSRCITYYLVSMAVTDLLVIITAVLLNRIPGIYFPGSFLFITPVCSLSIALINASRDSSVWLTVTFTFDRFVAICCQKLKTKFCTEKTAAVVVGVVFGLGCLTNIPWYFIHEPIYIINNVPWYCSKRDIRYTSLAWTAFDWTDHLLTPCFPFFLILLFNALTIRHIFLSSRVRRRLRTHSNGENQRDPEMKNRRNSIILLFAISSSFILLWIPYVLQFIFERFLKNYIIKGFSDPKFILQESANMLQLLSCCTNTFIYAVTQSKFRKQLSNMMHHPLNLICKFKPFSYSGARQNVGKGAKLVQPPGIDFGIGHDSDKPSPADPAKSSLLKSRVSEQLSLFAIALEKSSNSANIDAMYSFSPSATPSAFTNGSPF